MDIKVYANSCITDEGRNLLLRNGIGFTPYEYNYIYTHFNKLDNIDMDHVKAILCPCTGIEHLPENKKIFYLNDKEYLFNNIWSTAEHTVKLMLDCYFLEKLELSHCVVGLIGYGRVAKQVEQLLKGFSCTCLPVDKGDDFTDLFGLCDIISIHANGKGNDGLITIKHFQNITKPIVLINTARSNLVSAQTLIKSHRLGYLTRCGLDVTEKYSTDEMAMLREFSVITNHEAGKKIESRIKSDLFVINNFLTWING